MWCERGERACTAAAAAAAAACVSSAHPSTILYHPFRQQLGFNVLGYLALRFKKPRYLPLSVAPAKKAV